MAARAHLSLVVIVFFSFGLFSCGGNSNEESTDVHEALKLSAEKRRTYIEKGDEMVAASFKSLSGKLQSAIAEDGLVGAIKACNIHASPLVDSLSEVYNADIKRTAVRIRNKENSPTIEEKHIVKLYEKAKNNGQALDPVVLLHDSGKVSYYRPILVQPLCLNCHGEPGVSMSEEVYQTVLESYPYDRAIGYKLGELRGIWSIDFKE